jgi:IS5 family transposase
VRKGTLIDATVIGSASKGDKDAAWVRHRTRAPAMATRPTLRPPRTAASSAASRRPRPTPSIIPDEPGEVYAERAHDALAIEKAIEARGGTPKLMRKGHRWLAAERREAHNRLLRPIRARIEKIFGTWKRSYRFRCMRWIGLSKARLQVHLAVVADNVKRYWRMQTV